MPRLPVCADCRNCRDAFNAQLAERVRLKIQETEITFHPESLDDQDPATLTPETPTPGWWAAYREGIPMGWTAGTRQDPPCGPPTATTPATWMGRRTEWSGRCTTRSKRKKSQIQRYLDRMSPREPTLEEIEDLIREMMR